MYEKCPVDRASDAVGGAVRLAALLEVSPQAISNWKERGVPIERCVAIERLTHVSRRDLRPNDWKDIWPELEWDGTERRVQQVKPARRRKGE